MPNSGRTSLSMQDIEHTVQTNPVRALAVRVAVLCVGVLFVYAALPVPLEYTTWWPTCYGWLGQP